MSKSSGWGNVIIDLDGYYEFDKGMLFYLDDCGILMDRCDNEWLEMVLIDILGV